MNDEKIKVETIEIDGKKGYKIKILSDDATVEDYLQAVNEFISYQEYYRSRNMVDNCEGCRFCCNERIPLTNIDLSNIASNELIKSKDIKEVIKKWGYVYLEGPVVDIYLAKKPTKNCIFLHEETYRCIIYANRPLVCQTFICCPVDEDSRKLREAIVNSGEDQLVRDWLTAHQAGEIMHIDDAYEAEISLSDWHNNKFHMKTCYSEILIKDIVEESLWNKLRY